MDSALLVHRLHFAFTITFHYLFPQLTMGLAPLIVVLKTLGLRRHDATYDQAARFWARIFGINFVFGVVTGIPMEFEFGTNWARFSRLSGGVIGQPLAMEGVFSFFLESAFLGLFLYGEKRFSKLTHWFSAVMVFAGSWLSGFFIIVTDAWMQHPVGYALATDGSLQLASFWKLILNPPQFPGEEVPDKAWLSNLEDDRSEKNNLANQQPARVQELISGTKVQVAGGTAAHA